MTTLARDLVPADYRRLHLLRLFLPAVDSHGRPRPWSALLPEGEELDASADWNELYSRFAQEHPDEDWPTAARGLLDAPRAAALEDLLLPRFGPEAPFATKTWVGYAPGSAGPASSVRDGREYLHETLSLRELLNRARTDSIPDFGHDAEGRLAWGSNLYPDSLVIAADPGLFRAFFHEPHLEVASIRQHRDILPASSGD